MFTCTALRPKDVPDTRDTGDAGLKIALSGASNCGKTTLANQLSANLGLPIVAEDLAAFNVAIAAAQDPSTLLQVHVDFIAQKKASEAEFPGGFVADRTAIDIVMLFTLISPKARNSMSSSLVADFMARAKQTCEDYDYLIVPPWGAVSYQHPEHWSDENRHPPMNPWTNYARHMTILGLALDWMGHDRILLPPMEHMQNGTAVDWVKSALERR